ncbi:MAG: flavodoxin family protein [bacterium]
MANLLLVTHCPSENTLALRDAAIKGIQHPDITGIELRARLPLEAEPADVLWADGIMLGTTENFGYMAGRIKDFFERIYYPCLEEKQGTPFALYVRAGLDGQGTISSIERIVTGLRWNYVRPPLLLHGDWRSEFLEQTEELGQFMAVGLEAGIF